MYDLLRLRPEVVGLLGLEGERAGTGEPADMTPPFATGITDYLTNSGESGPGQIAVSEHLLIKCTGAKKIVDGETTDIT